MANVVNMPTIPKFTPLGSSEPSPKEMVGLVGFRALSCHWTQELWTISATRSWRWLVDQFWPKNGMTEPKNDDHPVKKNVAGCAIPEKRKFQFLYKWGIDYYLIDGGWVLLGLISTLKHHKKCQRHIGLTWFDEWLFWTARSTDVSDICWRSNPDVFDSKAKMLHVLLQRI